MRAPILVALLAACSSTPAPHAAPPIKPSEPPVANQPPPVPPELRLPAVARPTHEEVDLVLDPVSEDFTGRITTTLDVTKPTRVLWLNALEITVDDAAITVGGK